MSSWRVIPYLGVVTLFNIEKKREGMMLLMTIWSFGYKIDATTKALVYVLTLSYRKSLFFYCRCSPSFFSERFFYTFFFNCPNPIFQPFVQSLTFFISRRKQNNSAAPQPPCCFPFTERPVSKANIGIYKKKWFYSIFPIRYKTAGSIFFFHSSSYIADGSF